MNRWFCISIFWLCQLLAFSQAGTGGADDGFNPNTPPNPEVPRLSHWLTIESTPQQAGFIGETTKVKAGTRIWLEAILDNGYVLDCWQENNQVVSREAGFYYEMPDHDVKLTAVFRYDPATPGNPEKPRKKYTMTLEAQPWQAGYFNWNTTSIIKEEETVDVWAYNSNGYAFVEWQVDGQTVSKEAGYHFVMPSSDIKLTAIYEYSPELPGNPGTNYWNAETGEMIMDDFKAGGLWDAMMRKAGDDFSQVKMLTVVGMMSESDWGVVRNCTECTLFDFSRTAGLTAVPAWTFEGLENVTEVVLPATITNIGYSAFYGCTSLQTITCHALTPPAVESYAFDGLNEGVVVYVPATAVGQYQQADGWKNLVVLPMQDQVSALEVNLPDDENAALYKDMYIELVNVQTAQTQRYVITNRLTYTFANLIHHTQYNVYLKNQDGEVLGRIENVEIGTHDVSVTFADLLVPRDVTLKVLTPEGEDVTEQVTITWMDGNGEFLARGNVLAGQLEGRTVVYRITLPQALGMQYLLPQDADYEVQQDNVISTTLTAIPQVSISGLVKDVRTGKRLSGATIAVSQMLNGLYSKSYTTKTDSQGQWTMTVFDVASEITASMANYISKSQTLEQLTAEVPAFELKDVSGTMILLGLTYTDVYGVTHEEYDDVVNVTYDVYVENVTEPVEELSIQYPQIVLASSLPKGTRVRVVASSKTQKFLPVEASATVDEVDRVSITLPIKQLGGVQASYLVTDNTSVVGILYDQNGRLVKKYDYEGKSLTISELTDGNYTLVTMAGSHFFNSIYTLGQFAESGLRDGSDYVKNRLNVKSGQLTVVENQAIPYLEESKLYYTGNNTSIALNKNQATAGQYLTLSSHIDFKQNYAGRVTDVKLIVDLPEQSSFVDNSVMVGNSTTGYTYGDHAVMIPLANYGERVRFCFIPTAGGDFAAAATVQFTMDGTVITQPMGSVTYAVKDLSLNVPVIVASKKVPVSGTAVGKSTVKVFADGIQLGQTTALANGAWATTIELNQPESPSAHEVYAEVLTPQSVRMLSETQMVNYDETAVQVAGVTMYYTNPEENWWSGGKNYELLFDFMTPSVVPLRYTYYIFNRSFTFAVRFNQQDATLFSKVILDVKTGDGQWHPMATTFDAKKGIWLACGEFGNMYDGIVPVNVRVRYQVKGVANGSEVTVYYPGPNCDVPIDPSGYVYEAVPSNRVQGVKATIYYKETTEDQYGEQHENIVLWDAEEYAQENPLFTDENGMYRWDVPQGLWQVKFEKDGYETTYSAWMPVPPPQLDVNIAMMQWLQPAVKSASAFDKGVEMEFDKYMDPETLNGENIKVLRNGVVLDGSIELLNEETAGEGQTQTYASKVRFNVPESEPLVYTDEIQLIVSRRVLSYAGVPMEQDYSQSFTVEAKLEKIAADSLLNVAYGGERTLLVAALPVEASKGKLLKVRSLSSTIAMVSDGTLHLDENGQAEVKITGEMPGVTMLTFSMEGSDVEGRVMINVKEVAKMVTLAPRASRVSGSEVYRGTQVRLTSETENADIYYTLDGSEPTVETGIKYDDDTPIVIVSDTVRIKAIAIGHDLAESEQTEFVYTLKHATQNYQMPEGWSWISHNMADAVAVEAFKSVEHVLSQTGEAVKDATGGMVGSLQEMLATETYKVKVSAAAEQRLQGYEFDATSNSVPVKAGWNWIGYPVNQTMTLEEAFAYYDATEGDFIVGQDGFAEFVDGQWRGTLEGMKPGKGYLYKSAVGNEIRFNTTIVSVAASRMGLRKVLQDSNWAPVKYAYPDVMPLTAQLLENGTQVSEDDYVVGAFVNDECRGVGVWQDGRILMNVYGQTGDEIHFVALKSGTERLFNVSAQMGFQADCVGTWKLPYAMTIGNEVNQVELLAADDKIAVTPTVAYDHVVVTANGCDIHGLTLTDTSGKTLMTLSELGKGATLPIGHLPEGMYILTVKAGGSTCYKKIVKSCRR